MLLEQPELVPSLAMSLTPALVFQKTANLS